jgi:hypothetical protein
MAMKRHLARMANTDQRVVVVFMQVPGREDHALVVATDNLPPRWEQFLMQVVESPEGQSEPDLGLVLGRRLMPDTTDTLMAALHSAGLLRAVPINNVIMFPEPNRPYPLSTILRGMGRIIPEEYAAADEIMEAAKPAPKPAAKAPQQAHDPYKAHDPYTSPNHGDTKFNPHTANHNVSASEDNTGIARGLLMEAEMLETEARHKRERAYSQAPHLRPAPVRKAAPRPAPEPVAAEPVKVAKAKGKADPRRPAPKRAKNT